MDHKVAIVTGASSGIGATTARRLAGHVGGLVLHAHQSVDALEQIADELRRKHTQVITVLADLADAEIGKKLSNAAAEQFGRLDYVVANAGFPIIKSFDANFRHGEPVQDLRWDVNFLGLEPI